jgi:hypothetical protein
MKLAESTPIAMQSWKPLLIAPLYLGGAISERYKGTAYRKITGQQHAISERWSIHSLPHEN